MGIIRDGSFLVDQELALNKGVSRDRGMAIGEEGKTRDRSPSLPGRNHLSIKLS
jgi:hypothetical protein